ncbi:cell division protein FtsL [Dichelobacter nodosus]|uniref:Cell division protein FtsL n=2 Tax=Dichelobacter nodosus TaxID=870 RepID=A5EY10_DICNV|nr:cell division protein FtsL [Dichelobacter nodosus]ABQ13610.1 hypothetical protein DNO_0988 [Dichelobacter nodosus VCS1703A]AXM45774.1 cell division protein FtsL [Dichelobacter nodosus]KNZ39227.1 cell division protein FtsL [Dichelobacter nodosus]TGA64463.1 cell division protein FtsL [Dichelobacter nodosus]
MKWGMILVVLLSGVTYLGLKSAFYAHEHAQLVGQVQSLKQERDKINADWTQKLLEQKTLVNDAMIDKALSQGLNLHMPQSTQVVYLE